ncbi:MAG TPA: hypothetical protein VMK84_17840 [Streptosporangiaceae bacterium]|nr:hypothetical protein [Streptosporangiaceae bacterium]
MAISAATPCSAAAMRSASAKACGLTAAVASTGPSTDAAAGSTWRRRRRAGPLVAATARPTSAQASAARTRS